MFRTTLKNITDVDDSEWRMAYSDSAVKAMYAACASGQQVTVTGIEVDGETPEQAYYNVRLQDGTELQALQGVHLEGIDEYIPPYTLGARYAVELLFDEYNDGDTIDHAAYEQVIFDAINSALQQLTTDPRTGLQHPLVRKVRIGSVVFETDHKVE